MPTKLRRKVVRETYSVDPSYGETLIIELEDNGKILSLRQKGRRRRFRISYQEIWRMMLRIVIAEKPVKKKRSKVQP